MEDLGGRDLASEVAASGCPDALADEVAGLFVLLKRSGITHGDTKATNFLIHEDRVHLIDLDAMGVLNTRLRQLSDAVLICDEIYQGLQYGSAPRTALSLGADNVVVINSFSKFFGMTGWRLGWIVAPEWMIEPMERLAQNLFLAAPTVAQYAALAAFSDENLEILEQRRKAFEVRRDLLYRELVGLGLGVCWIPAGAFYIYTDIARFADDSMDFTRDLLEVSGVAVTPGLDFGMYKAAQHVRFAYTTGLDRLEEGIARLAQYLRAGSD
jgi:aspartate/methionine/tyrosine aminotransferase